jgi:hypothetical protein
MTMSVLPPFSSKVTVVTAPSSLSPCRSAIHERPSDLECPTITRTEVQQFNGTFRRDLDVRAGSGPFSAPILNASLILRRPKSTVLVLLHHTEKRAKAEYLRIPLHLTFGHCHALSCWWIDAV